MTNFNVIARNLMAGTAMMALAACGADDIASPGTGGNVTINNNTTTPPPPPPPPPSAAVTPAFGCPTIAGDPLVDSGTISGPTGEWRVCTLPARITTSITLPKQPGLLYRLAARVDVGTDQGPASTNTAVTLTIEPGVIVFGGSGVSWLHVNRGNRINAVGTATRPIIFTSRDNVIGANNENSSGQWGGVVLSGRAPITDCKAQGATPGTIACEKEVEGSLDPAFYGGANSADNSGTMKFVQIRYSGFVLSGASELQALTTGGTGSGTTLENIQSVNSSDDGAEFFGGSVNMKRFISVGAEDDNLDTDVGLKANFQYVIAVQRTGFGDSMIEADSDNDRDGNIPRQNTKLSNFTFVQRNNIVNQAAILLRGGTDYTMANGVVVAPTVTNCLRISRPQTASATVDAAIDEAGAPVFRSVVMQCNATPFAGSNGVTAAEVQTIFGSGANNNSAFTASLSNVFVNGANETAVTAFDAKTLNAYFDTTAYIGAVRNASDTWYEGWTCNTDAASFGTTNTGLCSTLPTY